MEKLIELLADDIRLSATGINPMNRLAGRLERLIRQECGRQNINSGSRQYMQALLTAKNLMAKDETPVTFEALTEKYYSGGTVMPRASAPLSQQTAVEMNLVDIDQMITCVKRELAMRKNVYGKRVTEGRMNGAEADREITAMQAVLNVLGAVKYADYEALRAFKSDKGQTELFDMED